MKSGYTLIELLIVVAIMSVVVGAGSNLFLVSLNGTAKERSIREVKQSGDYVTSVIEQQLRGAKTIVEDAQAGYACGNNMDEIVFENFNGERKRLFVYLDAGNYKIGMETLGVQGVSVLTNDQVWLVVDDNTPRFSIDCLRDVGSEVTRVSVNFDLVRGNELTDKQTEIATKTFVASVVLRNR